MKFNSCALMFALLMVSGCSKVNIENYDRLKVGMSYPEVKQLLGEPTKCDETIGIRTCEWGDSTSQITVSLAADRVVLFSAKGIK